MAFVGDGNNVTRSLASACGKFGMRFVLASPAGYELPPGRRDGSCRTCPARLRHEHDPNDAVREADVVVTDTWVSMGQEAEKQRRVKDFAGFQVDDRLLASAPKHAVVLHCLPLTVAWRSATRSWKAPDRSSSRKRKTACTPRRESSRS
jgi:ornithine carbamoyltransferase